MMSKLSLSNALERTRRSWRPSRGFVAVGVAAMCVGTPACSLLKGSEAGCSKDTDCKGDRICEAHRCVTAHEKSEAAAAEGGGEISASKALPEAADPSEHFARFARGGPGHAGPLKFEAPSKRPSVAWDLDLGGVIYASPRVVVGEGGEAVAYVGTHAGRLVGVAVDGPRSGTIVLDVDLGGRIWSTPWVDDERVLYVGTDGDELVAVRLSTGEVAWRTKIGSCAQTTAPGPEGARCDVDGGPTQGPGGDLYIGADGVYRIRRDGAVVWRWPAELDEAERPPHVASTPVVTGDGRVLFGGQDGFVRALDPDGTERWRYKVIADVDGSGWIGEDGEFVVGADDGRVYAIRRDGSLKWSFVAQKDIRSSVGGDGEGRLYVTAHDGFLYALSAAGAVEWVFQTDAPIQSTPVVDALGRVIVGGQDNAIYMLAPDGALIWELELPADVDSSVALSPAGTLVVGCDDGHLRAYRPGGATPEREASSDGEAATPSP